MTPGGYRVPDYLRAERSYAPLCDSDHFHALLFVSVGSLLRFLRDTPQPINRRIFTVST
jgi:hypothetical protein